MRVVQPAVSKRITFATWARKAGLRRHSTVSYFVPDDLTVPDALMVGAQVDGKPFVTPAPQKPKRTRKPKVQVVEPEPEPEQDPFEVTGEQPAYSHSPDDEPQGGTDDAMS